MNIDGWAILEVSVDGEKLRVKDWGTHDIRLEQMIGDVGIDCMNLEDSFYYNLKEEKDSLVMVFWKYDCVECGGWEYTEYEDVFTCVSYTVMQRNYKNFYHKDLSDKLTFGGIVSLEDQLNQKDNHWVLEELDDYQTFYDEDFEIHPSYIKEEKEKQDSFIDIDLF